MPEISNKLKDLYYKIAGVPVLALLVVYSYNLTAGNQKLSWSVLNFVSFCFISTALWYLNRQVQYFIRKRLFTIKSTGLRIITRFAVNVLITYILTAILFRLWNVLLYQSAYNSSSIAALQLISIVLSILTGCIYEIVYLNKERESDIIRIERTEKSKLQAQLDGLKNQVDPHFIFNSLNTLSYLISQNPETARLFNDTLARVYRYILVKKEKDLVLLKEEIEFASNYFYLLKIRYQTGLKMTIELDDIVTENYMLPPLSVQILIENAIKHNHFTEKLPLDIRVCVIPDKVTVTNNRNIKQFEIQSPQIGLKNLAERYMLITGSHINIDDGKEKFTVVLPLLKS
ncbi:MAG TPA: histidine kinase [Ferruginibacter sp.]|mgnify:CR=1 FL=1|nr:histidine kinase [Ferruginibacter sp.]HPH89403.1 histidine kinase [Ferruginibacter sp.]